MNPTDRAITQKIRKAIHEDNSLSTYAHNIKIITRDGKVTLRGPVRSEEEKTNLDAKAVSVAGQDLLPINAPGLCVKSGLEMAEKANQDNQWDWYSQEQQQNGSHFSVSLD